MKKEVIYSHDILRGKVKYRPVMVETKKKKRFVNNKKKEQMKILIIFETFQNSLDKNYSVKQMGCLLTMAKGL